MNENILFELENYCASSKDEVEIIGKYAEAVNSNDETKLLEFKGFGQNVRQRIMNINTYEHALVFGFNSYAFNEFGWMESNYGFPFKEELQIFNKSDSYPKNVLTFGESPNGKWAFGYSYSCGGAGGGSSLGVFAKPYDSKEECKKSALGFMKQKFVNAVLKNDGANFKMPYCQQILDSINNLVVTKSDYTTDKKGQILLFA